MVSKYKWTAENKPNGRVYAYRQVTVEGKLKSVKLHRFILGLSESHLDVDHKDHDGLNCQRHNLRISTRTQNNANMRRRSDNTSGYKGVSWCNQKKKWVALINKGGRRYYLGKYENKDSAAIAYNNAAVDYFGEFANLNEIGR